MRAYSLKNALAVPIVVVALSLLVGSAPACAGTLAKQTVRQKFKILDIKAAEVSFSGTGLHEVLKDDDSGGYSAPHWQDNSTPPNGTGTDPGDRRFPISYTGGSKVKATAKFRVKPDPPAGTDVRLRGINFSFTLPPQPATKSAGFLEYPETEAATALSAGVELVNSMVLTWEVSVNGGKDWRRAGLTGNRLYKTLANPLAKANLYQTVLHLATSKGPTTSASVATANTWSLFAGPANVKTWDGRSLFYYKPGFGLTPGACALNSGQLLSSPSGSGQCGSFALLLMDSLGANGIPSAFIGIGGPADHRFLVNNWSFSTTQSYASATPAYPWKMILSEGGIGMVPPLAGDVYGDLTSTAGLPGQNTPTPSEKVFGSHFIVKQGTDFYDPSYGVTYSGPADFQNKAVAGFARHFPGDATAEWHVKQPSGSTEIFFTNPIVEYK